MPKSLEHYQQESGRAGRDGLEAECCLLYSGGDYGLWNRMLDNLVSEARDGALRSLGAMYQFCTGATCRHRQLVEHFGQKYSNAECEACDICLGQVKTVDDPLILAQKILSCVVRLKQRFGADYTAAVLAGSKDQRILSQRHDELSTYGLLASDGKRAVRDWIEQLVGQEYLKKTGEYNTLEVTPTGWQLLKGSGAPRLLKPQARGEEGRQRRKIASAEDDSWEGVDSELFESLRAFRREKAIERGVPPYMIFGDRALRDMARLRPRTLDAFLHVKGVGERKCNDFGEEFIQHIAAHCDS